MDVAYVIVSYRTPRLAEAARTSVLRHRPQAHVLVVHADGPEERGGQALGYGAALNLGISALPSRAEIVCCLNADVEMLEPDEPVLDLFEDDPDLAVVGPRQVDAHWRIVHGGIVAHDDGTEWDLDLRHRCWKQRLVDVAELTAPTFEVPTVAGSVLYVRRSDLASIGGWPTWTRFYYEDTYLCYALRARSRRVLYTGSVTWTHLHERSPIGDRGRRMREAQRAFVRECRRAGIPLRLGAEVVA